MSDIVSNECRVYPCADCGVLRTAAEGGTVFTVCDACWNKAHPSELHHPRCKHTIGGIATVITISAPPYVCGFCERDRLQSALNRAESERIKACALTEAAEAENTRLAAEVERLTTEHAAEQLHNRVLRSRLADLGETRAHALSSRVDLVVQRDSLQSRVDLLDMDRAKLCDHITELKAERDGAVRERDELRQECEELHARYGEPSQPYTAPIRVLRDERDQARAERDALAKHYDRAAPEHNLLALLDLYDEREREARAEVERMRAVYEAASALYEADQTDAMSDGGLSPKHPETFMRLAALYAALDALSTATKPREGS